MDINDIATLIRDIRSGVFTANGRIRTPGTGVYPYDGLANRCTKNTSAEKARACETTKTQLTPQLTPESGKQGEIDIQNLPPDLAEMVAVWLELPEHIRKTFRDLVQPYFKEDGCSGLEGSGGAR